MNWIKTNWLKVAIALLVIERLYYYLIVNPQIFSFFNYAENIFGQHIK
jgi:hypothetical protein